MQPTQTILRRVPKCGDLRALLYRELEKGQTQSACLEFGKLSMAYASAEPAQGQSMAANAEQTAVTRPNPEGALIAK
jgi:hypothetical protein